MKDFRNHFSAFLILTLFFVAGCGNVTPSSSNVTPSSSNVTPSSSNAAPSPSNAAPSPSNVSSMISDSDKNSTCDPIGPGIKLGPALTIAEREAESLEKMKTDPELPQVPFGYIHDDWEALKREAKPGDQVHQYQAGDYAGGTMIVREGCIVGDINEWVR